MFLKQDIEVGFTNSFIVNSEYIPSADPMPELSFLNVTDAIKLDGVLIIQMF